MTTKPVVLLVGDDSRVQTGLVRDLTAAGFEISGVVDGPQALLPFVFLSTQASLAVVDKAAALGALGYLVKPVELLQLIPMIRTALVRVVQLRSMQRDIGRLDKALQGSRDVSVVTGLLMERFSLDQAAAYDKLRHYARSHRRKVSEVSGEILTRADQLRSILHSISRHEITGSDAT
ncbi:MAG: ANTAR domain-containing protein [Steroidobacteraceae bacterium]